MKKNLLVFILFLAFGNFVNAQNERYDYSTARILKENLPVIQITKDVNLHFRTPEPVQFVDLSTDKLIGDLPAENVVRIKIQQIEEENSMKVIQKMVDEAAVLDSIQTTRDIPIQYQDNQELGIVTIVGQSFMAQYKIVYKQKGGYNNVVTNIEILPNDMQPLEYPKYEFSNLELRKFSMNLITKKEGKSIRKNKDLRMRAQLNNIYTMGDYVFLDITFLNKSNLSYDIDQLKFSIDDKKIYKSTNVQSIDISPIYQLYNNKKFRKSYRNIYVFKKFTYPNNKVLNIRLIENQVSGRTISLEIKYSDILNADTF